MSTVIGTGVQRGEPRLVSHHLLRRRARARAKALNVQAFAGHVAGAPFDGYRYEVQEAKRGPWRWRVVRIPLSTDNARRELEDALAKD